MFGVVKTLTATSPPASVEVVVNLVSQVDLSPAVDSPTILI